MDGNAMATPGEEAMETIRGEVEKSDGAVTAWDNAECGDDRNAATHWLARDVPNASAAISADDASVLTAPDAAMAKIWSVGTGECVMTLFRLSAVFSPEGV